MLSVEYNEYYCGQVHESNWLEWFINELINEVELEDIIKSIELFAEENE